jgi:hypothetical protein
VKLSRDRGDKGSFDAGDGVWRDRSVTHCIRDVAELVAERESLACKDFARLQEQQKEPLNLVWVAYYWQQVVSLYFFLSCEVLICYVADVSGGTCNPRGEDCAL